MCLVTEVNASFQKLTQREFWQRHVCYLSGFASAGRRSCCSNRWTFGDVSPIGPNPACGFQRFAAQHALASQKTASLGTFFCDRIDANRFENGAYSGIHPLAQEGPSAYVWRMRAKPILIAGPTASGKSALSVRLARSLGGVIINADSQQIYRDWRILSARPSADEEATVPHRMYAHLSLDTIYSTGHWLDDITAELSRCHSEGLRPIIVGGTGLYFKALTVGLAKIPKADMDIRARGEAELERLGLAEFVEILQTRDPKTCARIDLLNPRRVLRAWEVLEATDKGIADWQDDTPPPLLPLDACHAIALTPPRDWLYERCELRFGQMIDAGVLSEVRAVMDLNLPADAPGLKAVGAPELMAHLRGEIDLDQAIERAKMETRRYAKRQTTWIRNQMQDWEKLDPTDAVSVDALIRRLVDCPAGSDQADTKK